MFANIQTLEVINRASLQALFPGTSFPDQIVTQAISALGFAVVEVDPLPTLSASESAVVGALRTEGERVFQSWTVIPTALAYLFAPSTREATAKVAATLDAARSGNWTLPAFACFDAPPEDIPAGKVARRSDDNSSWELVADNRGLVYSTANGAEKMEWIELGDLPPHWTSTPWPGLFYIWDNGTWKLDILAKRDTLMAEATARIAPLQDAVDLDEATSAEQAALTAWKRYRVQLNRIEQQAGYPDTIDWPVMSPASEGHS